MTNDTAPSTTSERVALGFLPGDAGRSATPTTTVDRTYNVTVYRRTDGAAGMPRVTVYTRRATSCGAVASAHDYLTPSLGTIPRHDAADRAVRLDMHMAQRRAAATSEVV